MIYCLSRKDCENLSDKLNQKLREKGFRDVRVSFYHAELDPHEKTRRHREWSLGRISVLCATIAFGMGIDKPDVRYVMHYSMPKSITHYYQVSALYEVKARHILPTQLLNLKICSSLITSHQESGRAGRDGSKADCILFYQYKDKKTLEFMIRKSSGNSNSRSTMRKIDHLYTCLRYCEDAFECRRTLQLQFFGELFDKSKCNETCDNCRSGNIVDKRDMTGVAREILGLLSCLETQKNGRGVTLLTLSELWRGTKAKSHTKFLNTDTLTGYGNGSKYSKHEVDTIAHSMVFENIVEEISEETGAGFAADYVRPGPKAHALVSGQHKFFVRFAAKKAPEQNDSKKKPPKSSKDTVSNQDNDKRKSKKDSYKVPKEERKGTNTMKSEVPNDVPHEFPDSDVSYDREIGAKRPIEETILPKEHTEVLLARIKKLVTMWAEEVGSNLLFVIV